MENLPFSSNSDSEVLILPSSYVPRRVKRFTPTTTSPSTTTTTTTASSSTSATQSQHEKASPPIASTSRAALAASAAATTTENIPTYPSVFYEDPSTYIIMGENQLLNSPQISRQCVFYALPGFGSTSLMISLIVQLQQEYPERWVSYMNLKKVATFMVKEGNGKVDENQWSLPGLVSAYSKITEESGLEQIASFFTTPGEDLEKTEECCRPQIMAELFLDDLSDVPPKMQNVLLKIIARDVYSTRCPTRIWMSARSHLKSSIEALLPRANVYELTPLLRMEQINLIATYWKITECDHVPDAILRDVACELSDQMEKVIPNFYKTLGACPAHLLQLPDFFTAVVSKLGQAGRQGARLPMMNLSVTKIFEKFVRTKLEAYVDAVSSEQPTLALSSVQFREKELRKMERIHVKAIIASYPFFTCDTKTIFTGNTNPQDQAHELYRVGICYEDKGMVKFVHQMYAEFIMAQFFVDSGRLKNTSHLYISFFLNNILFDDKCKATRKFFDAYLTVQQQERQKIRGVMVWNRLRCFLVKHYRLNEEACASTSSNDDDDNNEEDVDNEPKLTYDDIRMNGSVLLLSIMEGHFKIVQMIIDCFKGFPEELKKLLEITIPLNIYDSNPFHDPHKEPEVHVVDAFQMIALYGYGEEFTEKVISTWYQLFGEEYMKKRYFANGTWTVLHYAAMNANHHFLQVQLSGKEMKWDRVSVKLRNPKRQEPINIVLTKGWYYSIKIEDHPHPDMKMCPITSGLEKSASVASTSASKVIKEVINDVSISGATRTLNPPTMSVPSPTRKQSGQRTPKRKSTQKSGSGSKRKMKGNAGKTQLAPRRHPTTNTTRTQVLRRCKTIWCFEGINKEYVRAWTYLSGAGICTPLQAHLDTIQILLENGADVNTQNGDDGQTILHQAVFGGNAKMVRFLLEYGADVNVSDYWQRTPLDVSQIHKDLDVVSILAGKKDVVENGGLAEPVIIDLFDGCTGGFPSF